MESINPASGQPLARVKMAGPAITKASWRAPARHSWSGAWFRRPSAATSCARSRSSCARTKPLWSARHAGNGQDPARGIGRSPGDDRYRRFRRGAFTPALRPDHGTASRPGHRMYEQWHPLGIVGWSAPSIFRWRCGRGTLSSRRCAATACCGGRRRKRRSRPSRAEDLQPRARPARLERRVQPGDRAERRHREALVTTGAFRW